MVRGTGSKRGGFCWLWHCDGSPQSDGTRNSIISLAPSPTSNPTNRTYPMIYTQSTLSAPCILIRMNLEEVLLKKCLESSGFWQVIVASASGAEKKVDGVRDLLLNKF